MPDTLELGMPRKVLSLAMTMGAHGDCLVADYEGCCTDCRALMDAAFDLNYNPGGLRPLSEVLDELFDDMIRDQV